MSYCHMHNCKYGGIYCPECLLEIAKDRSCRPANGGAIGPSPAGLTEKRQPKEFSLMSHGGGIVLCDEQSGALLCLRFPEEVESLRKLLATIDVSRI